MINEQQITYSVEEILFKNARTIVYRASDKQKNNFVVKKISLDYKNEVDVWKAIKDKQYFAKLLTFFTSEHENSISLIFEYLPNTLATKTEMNHHEFKKYIYQLLIAIHSLHKQGYVHCNVNPQNCLIRDNELKLYDFSVTQKINEQGKFEIINCYTPPEVILGNWYITEYLDIWSIGCVICEVLLGTSLFKGTKPIDILLSIIKILGTPSNHEIQQMTNFTINNINLLQVNKVPFAELFKCKFDYYILDLISRMLIYTPKDRIKIEDAINHPFFQSDPIPQIVHHSDILYASNLQEQEDKHKKEIIDFGEYGTFKQVNSST
ncbi:unnamed protein product [Paramecium sonneborni]|uniref:Protein kinase domain-containing protein n=1 Tax=Paramecium sonneborni TaxID=65129 RepID=A0A8S1R7E4_9CILI|nr:unnamed protein product [Paramecium sonneborni]